ncbi:peroxisomal N(1)-acetyl-spermine/spermidine oxidase isoform X2 [Brienomyrus brachyistius]|nr:peroxisomal N(1)-acetyl-spermine/spermidine oxidase isoform X2 [Brienomyrus brachyistius]
MHRHCFLFYNTLQFIEAKGYSVDKRHFLPFPGQVKQAGLSVPLCNMSASARVIVIGAGLAGLAAAATLCKAGFQHVLILEATEKPGGRIDTTRPFGSDIIELGANWIHGRKNNPLYTLAKEHGLLHEVAGASTMCLPNSVTPDDYFFREDGQRLHPSDVEQVCALFGRLTARAFDGELEGRYLSGSLGHYLDEAFVEVFPDPTQESREVFEWCKRSECTDEASSSLYEVSASQISHYIALEGGFFNTLGTLGYQGLLDVLLKCFPQGALICNKPVQCVRWTMDSAGQHGKESQPVKLVCEDGQEYDADHVIVTASLGFLQERAADMFEPALPDSKAGAIQKLGFGTVDKIFLKFDERFWPDDCAGIQLVWKHSPEEPRGQEGLTQEGDPFKTWYKKICGFDVVARHPTVLCGWITGREAEHMETLSDEEVGDICVSLLRTFTSWPVPKPSRVLLSRWRRHPFVRGSYTYVPCGVDAVHEHQALAEPLPLSPVHAEVKPLQVLFAGEATHINFYTTTHGAYITGVREAERLINHYATQ